MKSLNPGAENGRKNGAAALGLRPDQVPSNLNIMVSHGQNEYLVSVPSNSSFADLKSVIAEQIGLKLDTHKLSFRGKEKEDDEYLESAGVKKNYKVLLVEDITDEHKIHEEVKETSVPSKGGEAVAVVKEEVDKLVEQVSALQASLDRGKKVDEKTIIFLTEMLMRQLLKLDGIEAEGEGKVQRKMEKFPFYLPPTPTPAPVPSSAATNPAPALSSSSSHGTSSATPYYIPTPTPSYGPSARAPYHYDAPSSHPLYHYDAPSSYTHLPYDAPPSCAHSPYDAPSSHAQFSYDTPYAPTPYAPAPYAPNPYAPSPYAPNLNGSPHHTPHPTLSYDPAATHSYAPPTSPSHAPPMSSSTKVTRDWEHFE